MTKKQFKIALLRGQGRCIQTLKENPAKYYPIMIWACRHEVSFDAQCEGSRAWFVYQLINCYQNKTPFLEAAITSFQNTKSNGGWKVLYLAELLSHFRDDGEKTAEHALWQKYEELYSTLLKKNTSKKDFSQKKMTFPCFVSF